MYEVGQGRRNDLLPDKLAESVSEKTAQATGTTARTVERAREYSRLIKERQDLKKEKVSTALALAKKDKKLREIETKVKEIKTEDLGIYEGDCLELIESKVKDNSVACLIIDPPYGIDYQSNHKLAKHDKIINDSKEAINLLDKSLTKVKSKLLDDSHIYIFTSWKVYDKIKPIVEKHFEIKNCLIWNKNNWDFVYIPYYQGEWK